MPGQSRPSPFLSVVATSRNDNHGGNLTRRMQHFVTGLAAQCQRHRLGAELILVDWNPPSDRPSLFEELAWPAGPGACEIRIITVPRELHARFAHSDKIPLFQMIAKNVGIRRARGEFVLATNIDILFSDEAILFMRDKLRPRTLYRVDRWDIPSDVPETESFERVMEFCQREGFRINANGYTFVRKGTRWTTLELLKTRLPPQFPLLWDMAVEIFHRLHRGVALPGGGKRLMPRWSNMIRIARTAFRVFFQSRPHTNACGDFTLMSRDDWFVLRGYPEWAMYSFHIDSILLYQAKYRGIREKYLGRHVRIYHIDHEAGSGFTPEAADKLFARLEAKGIPYLDWERDVGPMIREMENAGKQGKDLLYNSESWGFSNVEFPEQIARRAL